MVTNRYRAVRCAAAAVAVPRLYFILTSEREYFMCDANITIATGHFLYSLSLSINLTETELFRSCLLAVREISEAKKKKRRKKKQQRRKELAA